MSVRPRRLRVSRVPPAGFFTELSVLVSWFVGQRSVFVHAR